MRWVCVVEVVVTNIGGVMYDDGGGDGKMVTRVVVAAGWWALWNEAGQRRCVSEWLVMVRRVEARVLGDRVDPVMRFTFGLGRNTRRKSFLAAVGRKRWLSEVGEAAGHGREERESGPNVGETSTNPKLHNHRRSKQRVELFSLEETPVDTMADQLTMAELLQAPTEGYGDAIVIPAILAENFELKHGLLNLITSKQFYGFEKEDPYAHIRWFNKM
ncbi:hypothetical protein Tco_0808145 [Tanacetum coccineum]